MMTQEDKIIEVLKNNNTIKAILIAEKIGITKKEVNSILYANENKIFKKNENYQWSLVRQMKKSQVKTSHKEIEQKNINQKFIKRELESPSKIVNTNKTIGDLYKIYEISLDAFKKEIAELSFNLISNKINFNTKRTNKPFIYRKINKIEFEEIKNHLIKKGYKRINKKDKVKPKFLMPSSRLSKVAKELNIGISTIKFFLKGKGIDIDWKPNSRIDNSSYELLKGEFSKEKPTIKFATSKSLRNKMLVNQEFVYNSIKSIYKSDINEILIEELQSLDIISARSFNVLKTAKIINAKDIIEYFKIEKGFEKIRNCGNQTNKQLSLLSRLIIKLVNEEQESKNRDDQNITNEGTKSHDELLQILDIVFKNIINTKSNNNKVIESLIKKTNYKVTIDILSLIGKTKIIYDQERLKLISGIGINKINRINHFFKESSEILDAFLEEWNNLPIAKKDVIKNYISSKTDYDLTIFSSAQNVDNLFRSIENNESALEYYLKYIYENRNKHIILQYVFQNLNQTEIANKNNLSRERIRQIISAFIEKDLSSLILDTNKLSKIGLNEIKLNSNELFLSVEELKNYDINLKFLVKLFDDKIQFSHDLYDKYGNVFGEFYLNKSHNVFNEILTSLNHIHIKLENDKIIHLDYLNNELLETHKNYIENYYCKIFNTEYIFRSKYYIYSRTLTAPEGIKLCVEKYFTDVDFRLEEIYNKCNEIFHKDFFKISTIKNVLIRISSITTYGKKGIYTLKKNFPYEGKNTTRDIIIDYLRVLKNPERIEIIEKHVLKLNPYLRKRSTLAVIDLNDKYFIKYIGTGYVGLASKKYNEAPILIQKKTIKFIKSKNNMNELEFQKLYADLYYSIPTYQLNFYLNYNSNKNKSIKNGEITVKLTDIEIKSIRANSKLIVNDLYTKNDLYKIFNVSKEHQNGKWRNGYCEHEGEYFVFANLGIAGQGFGGVHFDYKNGIDQNGNLEWEAKNGSMIHHPSIQNLIKSKPFIFIRTKDVDEPYWKFIGHGKASKIKVNSSPVCLTWILHKVQKNKIENFIITKNKDLKDYFKNQVVNMYNNGDISFVKIIRENVNKKMSVNECIKYVENLI